MSTSTKEEHHKKQIDQSRHKKLANPPNPTTDGIVLDYQVPVEMEKNNTFILFSRQVPGCGVGILN